MINGYVRPSLPGDPDKGAPILRAEDQQEIDAALGLDHVEILSLSMHASPIPLTIVDANEEPFAMLGAARHSQVPEYGHPWLLSSDYLFGVKLPFIRQSRMWRDVIEQPYKIVGNVVDERNAKHVRWLKWLGYNFVNRHPEYGVQRKPFLEFTRICHV